MTHEYFQQQNLLFNVSCFPNLTQGGLVMERQYEVNRINMTLTSVKFQVKFLKTKEIINGSFKQEVCLDQYFEEEILVLL